MNELSTPRRLTTRQRAFVAAYLGQCGGNATESAKIAGYNGNEKSLAVTGSQLLRVPHVILALERITAAPGVVLTRNERQAFWSVVINSAKVSMRDRLKASEMLAKSQGDFIERREVLTRALSMSDDELRAIVRERLARDVHSGGAGEFEEVGAAPLSLLTESVSTSDPGSGDPGETVHPGARGGPSEDNPPKDQRNKNIQDNPPKDHLNKNIQDNPPEDLPNKNNGENPTMSFADKLKTLLKPENIVEGE